MVEDLKKGKKNAFLSLYLVPKPADGGLELADAGLLLQDAALELSSSFIWFFEK